MSDDTTATAFVAQLERLRDEASAASGGVPGDARVPVRQLFALAKTFIRTPCAEIETLLEHREHDTRVGAVSIMDWQARRRTTSVVTR